MTTAAMTTADRPRSAICFEEVSKRFGRHQVLDGLELEVGQGEFFGLVGVNGAGKTTSIKSLLEFCSVDAGSIRIFGVPHTDTRARARLAYLPERFLPPYYLRGRDFLAYMARLHRVSPSEAEIAGTIARLDLECGALAKPVAAYSKGMAQKLGIAACLLSGKDLFVLDEPMSGLDPKARALAKRELADLKRRGRTVFFSTHLLTDVQELCDRMGVLHGGALRFSGTPAACCETFGAATLEEAYLRCIAEPGGESVRGGRG